MMDAQQNAWFHEPYSNLRPLIYKVKAFLIEYIDLLDLTGVEERLSHLNYLPEKVCIGRIKLSQSLRPAKPPRPFRVSIFY